MVHLEYKSLVTKENIDYYLSIIKNDREKKDFINTISKFDIRISTKPVIKGDEFYYKIWILRRVTKKKAHIKDYYSLELLKEKSQSPITLAEILEMVRINADVPDDFEEYCQIRFEDPSDEICRCDYLDDLRRAERFKRFKTQEEIRSFPSIIDEKNNNKQQDNEEEKAIRPPFDLNNEHDLKLLGYSIVFLNDKKEYDKLAELQKAIEYYAKIVESYDFDTYTGDVDEKMFPITKEDKQMNKINEDFDNYDQAISESDNYLKELIKKYNIKPPPAGNLVKLAFNLNNNNNDNNDTLTQQYFKFIRVDADCEDVFPNT